MASSNLKPPTELNFEDSNLAVTWKAWKQKIQLYTDLALNGKDKNYQRKTFLYVIGETGREIYETLTFKKTAADGTTTIIAENDRTVADLISAFDGYCIPKSNETLERYHFFTRSQSTSESIEQYVTALRTLSKTCNFGDLTDSLIKDRVVHGVAVEETRTKLLEAGSLNDLDLAKCMAICKAVECAEGANKAMATASTVKKFDHKDHKPPVKQGKCKFCGSTHIFKKTECPAWGQTCSKCDEPNHFAKCCEQLNGRKRRPTFKKKHHKARMVEHDDDDSEDDSEYELVNAVNGKSRNGEVFARMLMNRTEIVRFQLDSGATCNILPLSLLNRQQRTKIDKKKSITLRMYNEAREKTVGKLDVKLINPKTDRKYLVRFNVMDDTKKKMTPIIGSTAAQSMGFIEVKYHNIAQVSDDSSVDGEKIMSEFKDVFTGQGRLPGECHLVVDENIKPVVQPPRRVPVAIREQLKKELDRLEDQGILSKQNEPTDWVSSLVCVTKKSGALRVCIDPKPLNTALKRNHYPMKTIDDILPDLGRMKVFSTFDARNGYWHVKLDRESSLLTCFNTIYGKYIWNVLPMGIKPAAEEYQKRQDDVVSGLPGVFCIADDILVGGEGATIEEATKDHDRNVRQFLERCRERGLKLNASKMKLKQESVAFMGHLLTRDGLKPDPEKVKAIVEMPPPEDVTEARRFLGMVTYLMKFLPSLSDIARPIRQLTQDDVEYQWASEQEKAFRDIKSLVTSAPVLRYFNQKDPVVIQCDASSIIGLGSVLLQKDQPVCFASRTLTDTETRYSIMELELLAVLFSVSKYHQFIFGCDVEVHTDHKPLESIFMMPIHKAPKRLQRMLVQLQHYNLKVVYKPGATMVIADLLSRAIKPTNSKPSWIEREVADINALRHVPISDDKLVEIQKQTEIHLRSLKEAITNGWTEKREDLMEEVKPYFSIRGELTVYDGIILKGDQVVIPIPLRRDILRQLHSTHIGIESCVRRARECVYWPGYTAEIKDYLAKCDVCATFANKNQQEPLKPHELTTRPWEKVGIDIFTLDQREYLVCVDYYSNFTEIDYLQDQKAETVIHKLKMQFARHGIPDIVFSDQAAIFTGSQFKKFATKWSFIHTMSSSRHASSNGRAENAVNTMKKLMMKARKAGEDPYLAILEFRNTPSQHINTSPTQRLFNRKTKTTLPTTTTALMFKPKEYEEQYERRQENQVRMKSNHDKHSKSLPRLNIGDTVRIQPEQHHKEWKRGEITGFRNERSYDVKTPTGKINRNRIHLKPTIQRSSEESSRPEIHYSPPRVEPQPSEQPLIQPTSAEGNMNAERRSTRIRVPPVRFNDYDM